ncbi:MULTISPECIES: flavin reductase family protein [unclassified Pseudomonas]|uniref:flavin reductase family protein n=1 Tax=unclassified Pseudomonas TaxID=196821 RepID=UPI000BDD7AD2|nr:MULTISPECIES: flavin reductase family protein [unclassified Pseudomonas]PVZ12518.1 flavin reductase (DIM6/NTAB) family NADH-FMN oxidoreductase RutF [Pseudomonas sp. URIL14HWK12:I12]PVZ23330.1 flavin reductase (DIM6/NTAB) family NADH-FMN oxidoreductase RutF [Pseudomonas sp. URIL14HWK12:I10]PVZ32660.1 flavin reductase (DIM6/NTAB) family NADH-FMN oxidoreductase RutF [Pseudomonas sp. URIL14HWK12:I11]SNZ13814.1 NADH-FMN oxidoreductase RutF, flavin reductase (DIM6/NTAB) family [Pseudomonas sp. URI
MSDAMHFYETAKGHGLAHDPFKAIIAPRPIGWVSSCSPEGILNLAPYSFFNAFADKPPVIGFSSLGRKDSLANIESSGEFVWNLSTWPLAQQMNQSSAPVGPQVSEFELAGVTPAESRLVKPPRVMESPVAFECKVSQIIQLTTAAGEALPNWLVLGEVVAVHIAKAMIKDGVYDTVAADPIMRGGGPADYFRLGERFAMTRPQG